MQLPLGRIERGTVTAVERAGSAVVSVAAGLAALVTAAHARGRRSRGADRRGPALILIARWAHTLAGGEPIQAINFINSMEFS